MVWRARVVCAYLCASVWHVIFSRLVCPTGRYWCLHAVFVRALTFLPEPDLPVGGLAAHHVDGVVPAFI